MADNNGNAVADDAAPAPKYIEPPTQCSQCSKMEEDLGGARLQICSRCYGDAYCSRNCQQIRWQDDHKKRCTDIGVWNLLQAIEHNDLTRVIKLSKTPKIANGESKRLSKQSDSFMQTIPVMACVRYDNSEALRILLESSDAIKIDKRDCDGDTALHMAASKRNNGETIKLLLQHGADPNTVASDGFSVLMMAARDFNLENTQCILDTGMVAPQQIQDTLARLQMMSGGTKRTTLAPAAALHRSTLLPENLESARWTSKQQ